ncbi:MAG: hypothetical protein V3V08_19410 [Nannocystaceae bacterium]
MSFPRSLFARCVGLLVALAWLLPGPSALAQDGRPDPRAMSGIPRVDPQLAVGVITVRCLRGSFSQPAVGIEVQLELVGLAGAAPTRRVAVTAEQGRARFDGLGEFVGSTAIATTTIDGELLRSRPIPLSADAGTAVMLVKGGAAGAGAGKPGAASDAAHSALGRAGMPTPGRVFPLRERPAGTLVVGTFDLKQSSPVIGIEVLLTADLPGDGENPLLQRGTTVEDGRVIFEGLRGDAYPEGTRFRVEVAMDPDQPAQESEAFEMDSEHGMALVFLKGPIPRAPTLAPPAASPLGPARGDPSLAEGTVRVRLVDALGGAIADHDVHVVRQTMRGAETRYLGRTDATGTALVQDVGVAGDAFYFAGARYDGAPFRSGSFRLDTGRGAEVSVRVYEVTSDVDQLRSAAQFDVTALENDRARVLQMYEAVLEGDKAFWVPGGLKIHAARGGSGVRVMRGAEKFLTEGEDAPFATISRPLVPGERIVLSVAYLMSHSGALRLAWNAPFPLRDARVSMSSELRVVDGASGPATVPGQKSGTASAQLGVHLYPLEMRDYVDGPCQTAWRHDPSYRCPDGAARRGGVALAFSVVGLPAHDPLFRYLGLGFAGVIVIACALGFFLANSVGPRQALLRRRDALLARARALEPERDARAYAETVRILDRIYRQLDGLRTPPT